MIRIVILPPGGRISWDDLRGGKKIIFIFSFIFECVFPSSSTPQPVYPFSNPTGSDPVKVLPANEWEDACDNTSLLWTVLLQIITMVQDRDASHCTVDWVVWSSQVCMWSERCLWSWFTISRTELSAKQQEKLPGVIKQHQANWLLGSAWCLVARQHKSNCIAQETKHTILSTWRMCS